MDEVETDGEVVLGLVRFKSYKTTMSAYHTALGVNAGRNNLRLTACVTVFWQAKQGYDWYEIHGR